MMQPIRGDVYVACEWGEVEPEDMTFRQAIEWYKRASRILRGLAESLGPLSHMETSYINQRWVALCGDLAKREGLPVGALSYFLHELAAAEMRALELAEQATLEG